MTDSFTDSLAARMQKHDLELINQKQPTLHFEPGASEARKQGVVRDFLSGIIGNSSTSELLAQP